MLVPAISHAVLVLVAMVIVMTGAWWFQRRVGNAGWIDVFWTFGTGATGAAVALSPVGETTLARQLMVAGLVALWSLRLGIHLARRVAGSEEDMRYAELRRQWGERFQPRLLRFVMWQPPVTALLALSVFVAAHSPGAFGLRDVAGLAVLALAIAGEAVADDQMRRYKQRVDRPPVMDRGLWGHCRHPNYFFEWLGWVAYPIIAFSPFSVTGWLTLMAPALMYLVLRHATGVTMLEASMLERKGADFRDYQERVNTFFPSLRSGTR